MFPQSGYKYTINRLYPSNPNWNVIQNAINKKINTQNTSNLIGSYTLEELYDIRWINKPFPWSYERQFKPYRRFFFHGSSNENIQRILDDGFKICLPINGRMLGDGVYLAYHSNKAVNYSEKGYVLSVMIYAPDVFLIDRGVSLDLATIGKLAPRCQAIEVRSGSTVIQNGTSYTMKNHEICVFDTRRIVPRFLWKVAK